MTRFLIGLLFGVALFFAYINHAYAAKYPDEAKSTLKDVTVHVMWYPDYGTVDLVCSYIAGSKPEGTILACYEYATSTIHAVEPSSFNDQFNLMILGHEFWHALGATHP